MKVSPLVSIIIPTYNNRDVVCDAIDCSLNQAYDNLEIIVIDDGSTDETETLLNEKYGSRIVCIRQKNRGLSSARNAGIRNASGKYLQFLDADDLIDQSKISTQVEQLQSISGLAVAYCDYVRTAIDDISIKFERMSPVLKKPFDDLVMKWETEISIPPHCFLFDADLFKKCGISFDERLPTHEDWDCWMNVFALNPKVVFIDKPLANYRMRNNSMCSNRSNMRKGYLIAINNQIHKNRSHKEVVATLKVRKKQIKRIYRDVSPIIRIMERCHPLVRNIYVEHVPLRIRQRVRSFLLAIFP